MVPGGRVARPPDGPGRPGTDVPGTGEGRRTRPDEGKVRPAPGVVGRAATPGGGPTGCRGEEDANPIPGTGGTFVLLLSKGLVVAA